MLNVAIQAARSAGRIIVRFVDRLDTIDVNEKSRNEFVTQVDHLAEQEIIQTIRQKYPNHAILAEESGITEGDENFLWIIDPLDGTTNFIHGFPQFSVSIALQHRGKLEVGVIYDPLRQELYTATRGQGAQLNSRKIRVSQCKKLNTALIGTGFPYKKNHHFKSYIDTFEAIFPETVGVRRAGSAALDLAYVAAGRLDGFWEISLKEWDMAAGVLLVKEAGGLVGDFHGEDQFMDSGNLVAANSRIYKILLEKIQASLLG